MNVYTLLFFIISSHVWSSAECSKSTHTQKSLGEWEINFVDVKNFDHISLEIKNDGFFFKGLMFLKDKKKGIDVLPCEGDCCNGFSITMGTLNFWDEDSNNFLGKSGRFTLNFKKIDWSSGTAAGDLRDQSWNKVSSFTAKKIKNRQ